MNKKLLIFDLDGTLIDSAPDLALSLNAMLTVLQREKFEDAVIDAFDGYHYEGEEEVIGLGNWVDLNTDGDYELSAKVNHEDAYELTLYVSSKDGKITVNNVL